MAYRKMKKESSIRTVLSFITLAALIAVSGITIANSAKNKTLYESTRDRLVELEADKESLTGQVNELDGLLEDSETTISGLEQSISSKNTQIDNLASDLNQVMAEVEQLRSELETSGSNVEELTAQLNAKLSEVETMTQQINTLVDEVVRLQAELENLQSFDVVWNLEEGFDYYEGFDYLFLGDIFNIAINNVQVFKNGLEIDSSIYRIWVNSIFNFINVHVHDIQHDKIVYSESLRYNPINTFGDFYNYPITIYSIDQLTPELFSINVRGETIIPTFGDYTQIENINFSQYSENYINLIYTYNEQIIENQYRVIVDPAAQFYQYDFSSDLINYAQIGDETSLGRYAVNNITVDYNGLTVLGVEHIPTNGSYRILFEPTVGVISFTSIDLWTYSPCCLAGSVSGKTVSSVFFDRSTGSTKYEVLSSVDRVENETQIIYTLVYENITSPITMTITK